MEEKNSAAVPDNTEAKTKNEKNKATAFILVLSAVLLLGVV